MLARVFTIFLISIITLPVWAANQAPQFSLPSKNGNINLNSLQGQVVYVDFWASWCSPCRKSFPWMNEMANKYKDMGFTIIAINLDKERNLADDFLKDIPHDFTIAFDPEGDTASAYKVRAMPSSYLIDKNGNIQYTHLGFRSENKAELESQIKSLLKQ